MKEKTKFKETEIGLIPEEWEIVSLNEMASIAKDSWKPGGQTMKYIGLEHINADNLSINGYGNSDLEESVG